MDWEQTLERVRSAAQSCAAANLSRLRIDDGEFAVEVRSSVRAERTPGSVSHDFLPSNGKTSGGTAERAEPPRNVLRAEFVGILRFARPLVVPGTVLADDRELAYVESLGIRNPVRSGGPGRVVEIFVGDGEAVDFGQKLFALET